MVGGCKLNCYLLCNYSSTCSLRLDGGPDSDGQSMVVKINGQMTVVDFPTRQMQQAAVEDAKIYKPNTML